MRTEYWTNILQVNMADSKNESRYNFQHWKILPVHGMNIISYREQNFDHLLDNKTEVDNTNFNLENSETTYNCDLYRFIMSVGLTGSLCIFGIVGNILTLLVLRKFYRNSSDRKTRSSAHLLLSGLAASDTLLLLALFIMKTTPSFISFTKIYPQLFLTGGYWYWFAYGWPCMGVTLTVNTWVTVLITIHRFIAIISPHKASIYCTYSKAKIHLIALFLIVTIYALPTFWELEIIRLINPYNETIYVPSYSELSLNYWYQFLYKTTLYYLFMYIIPWIFLAIMTIFLVKAVKQAQHFRSEMGNNPTQPDNTEDVTISLTAVVATSLLCRPWEPIRRIIDVILEEPAKCGHYYFYFEEIPPFFTVLNSSVNFVFYCLFLKRFSETLKSLFYMKKPIQTIESSHQSVGTKISTI